MVSVATDTSPVAPTAPSLMTSGPTASVPKRVYLPSPFTVTVAPLGMLLSWSWKATALAAGPTPSPITRFPPKALAPTVMCRYSCPSNTVVVPVYVLAAAPSRSRVPGPALVRPRLTAS